jgi:hypothetical protein
MEDHSSEEQQPLNAPQNQTGNESVIAEYCRKATENGHTQCIWLCMRRNSRYIMKDIPLNREDLLLGSRTSAGDTIGGNVSPYTP